jgi:Fe2+ or Zn2+ uptake regulation protein
MKNNLFTDILHKAGIKATGARIAVCRALANERYPISIKELGKKVSSPNQSTLYRVLTALVDKGLVREVLVDKSEARYEIAFGRRHHHHIICTGCGAIDDIDTCPAPLNTDTASKKFAYVTGHSLEYFGVCKTCA